MELVMSISKSPPSQQVEQAANQGIGNIHLTNKNLIAVVFLLVLQAMNVKQQTVWQQAKALDVNASAQNALNAQDENIHFSLLPSNAKTNTIDQVQAKNQQYAAQRANTQNYLISLRQNAQVLATQTSVNVNGTEQDTTLDGALLHDILSISQAINKLSPGSSS